jgi:hypothetical protein
MNRPLTCIYRGVRSGFLSQAIGPAPNENPSPRARFRPNTGEIRQISRRFGQVRQTRNTRNWTPYARRGFFERGHCGLTTRAGKAGGSPGSTCTTLLTHDADAPFVYGIGDLS